MKVEAREEKAKALAEKKTTAAQKKSESRAAALKYGSALVGCLTDSSHISKLTVPQLHAALMFSAVTIPKASLKPDLQSLLRSALSLPSAESPPLLALPAPPPAAPVPSEHGIESHADPPSAHGSAKPSASGSKPPPEDGSSSEESDDDDF